MVDGRVVEQLSCEVEPRQEVTGIPQCVDGYTGTGEGGGVGGGGMGGGGVRGGVGGGVWEVEV